MFKVVYFSCCSYWLFSEVLKLYFVFHLNGQYNVLEILQFSSFSKWKRESNFFIKRSKLILLKLNLDRK